MSMYECAEGAADQVEHEESLCTVLFTYTLRRNRDVGVPIVRFIHTISSQPPLV
jgi:hypothetical protein